MKQMNKFMDIIFSVELFEDEILFLILFKLMHKKYI